jgi:hypothetical protein
MILPDLILIPHTYLPLYTHTYTPIHTHTHTQIQLYTYTHSHTNTHVHTGHGAGYNLPTRVAPGGRRPSMSAAYLIDDNTGEWGDQTEDVWCGVYVTGGGQTEDV